MKKVFAGAGETPPICVNELTLGLDEADVLPFEDATFDFANVNEYLLKNPAVRQHVIPDAMVSSCSECCMERINGRHNVLGAMFRKSRKGKSCSGCPVSIASEKLPARRADGSYLRSRSGQLLSKADVVRMAEDGER